MTREEIFYEGELVDFNVDSKTNAVKVLGSHYEDLYTFYKDILFQAKDYDYVAFVVRRSLLLARIFYQILIEECETEEERTELYKGRRKFCSDTMVLSMAPHWGEKIIEERFPKLLLVDELVMQGDSLNEFLLNLEKKVIASTCETNGGADFTFTTVQEQMIRGISIKVFCRNTKMLLFYPAYQEKFRVMRLMEEKEWHDFSRRASLLINDFFIINASFTQGLVVPPHLEEHLNQSVSGFHALCSESLELKERVFFYQDSQKLLGCSMVVRAVYCSASACWTLIPFVFLPDLSSEQFDVIADDIFARWLGYSVEYPLFEKGTVNRYEAVSLFLSTSLLELFVARCFGQSLKEFQQQGFMDQFCVNTNFGFCHKEFRSESAEFMERLYCSEILFSEIELEQCLWKICGENKHFLEENSHPEKDTIFHYNSKNCLKLEDLIYRKKIDELEFSFKKRQGFYLVAKTERSMRNFPLQEFTSECLTELNGNSMEFVTWLFQFMDRGILTLKVKNEENQIRQLVRTGEASIFLLPKRYKDFISMILSFQRQTGKDENALKRFLKELEDGLIGDPFFKDAEGLADRLFEFLQCLERSDQTLNGWNYPILKYGVVY